MPFNFTQNFQLILIPIKMIEVDALTDHKVFNKNKKKLSHEHKKTFTFLKSYGPIL